MSLKMIERVPLSKLQIIEEMPSPLQRKAKIYSRRLPQDFFGQRNTSQQCRNQTYSQRLSKRVSNPQRPSQTSESNARPVCLTSRKNDPDDTMDLLKGVIATSREMRRMIRRHSLQMKKENNLLREINQYRVELPPLLLKKGMTMPL